MFFFKILEILIFVPFKQQFVFETADAALVMIDDWKNITKVNAIIFIIIINETHKKPSLSIKTIFVFMISSEKSRNKKIEVPK
jgi:hypothetical protein